MTEQRELRVLIVDDDPVIRLLAAQALQGIGLSVTEAENGEQALASLEESSVDLVVLDVELPGMDGFETCEILRQRSSGAEIPVLMATGRTDSGTIDRAFEVGATDFIKKPIDWQLLQYRVRFLMRASEAFAEVNNTLADLEVSQERLAHAQRLACIGNWEWVVSEPEMLWSEQVYRMLGIEMRPGSSTVERLLEATGPEDRETLEKSIRIAAAEGQGFQFDHQVVTGDGSVRVMHHHAEVMRDASGAPERVLGTLQDITERRRAEEQVRFLAYYDSLTALPNRRLFNEHLERTLRGAAERGERLALLFLDLDRFKRINDTLGHAVGDELLKAAAGRLVSCVRPTDFVGRTTSQGFVSRLGGDEFTIMLKGIDGQDAGAAARRIIDVLRKPFMIEEHQLVTSGSVGIALYPGDGEDANTLLRNADAAMYHAKAQGKDTYQFFSDSMNEKAVRSLDLESRLRMAIETDQLLLHYQPLQDVRSGELRAVEALVRWQSPELGLISPGEFIPVAEETGLILPLGEWVLRTACKQAQSWREQGLGALRISINISSIQVRRPGLVEQVSRILSETGTEPGLVELEITESSLLCDEPGVVETLLGLKELGVRLALDDFGTGFSSLSHLIRFPIDVLKIDQSFVNAVDTGEEGEVIIAAVVAMAHRLGLEVTAEGVETESQEVYLRAEGCDTLQGFHIGRPVPAATMVEVLREQARRRGPLRSARRS